MTAMRLGYGIIGNSLIPLLTGLKLPLDVFPACDFASDYLNGGYYGSQTMKSIPKNQADAISDE